MWSMRTAITVMALAMALPAHSLSTAGDPYSASCTGVVVPTYPTYDANANTYAFTSRSDADALAELECPVKTDDSDFCEANFCDLEAENESTENYITDKLAICPDGTYPAMHFITKAGKVVNHMQCRTKQMIANAGMSTVCTPSKIDDMIYVAVPVANITLIESGTIGNKYGTRYTATQTPTIEDCAQLCIDDTNCGGIAYGTEDGESTDAGDSER